MKNADENSVRQKLQDGAVLKAPQIGSRRARASA